MPPPAVAREFVGMPSPSAARAGAGGHPCQGLYHHAKGTRPTVAVIATHYQIDFSEHYLADHLAARDVGFRGWNTRFRGVENSFALDHALVDIGVGVRWLEFAQTSAAPHLARISCPALVINADHYFTMPGARDEQAELIVDWIATRWS
jgi:hypothetical protein